MTESNTDTCHIQIQGLVLFCDVWNAASVILIGPMVIIQQGEWEKLEVASVYCTLDPVLTPVSIFLFYFYNNVLKYV